MEFGLKHGATLALTAGLVLSAAMSAEAAPRGAFSVANVSQLVENAPFGTPAMINGEFRFRSGATEPVLMARAFLKAQSRTLRLTNADQELRLNSVIGPDQLGMYHVKFDQMSQGVPVFASQLIVHIDGDTVTGVNGSFLPSVRENLTVLIQGDQAAGLAIDRMTELLTLGQANAMVADRAFGLDLTGNPELVFFNLGLLTGEQTASIPAWKISVNQYVFFISARDGRLLDHWDTIHSAAKREVYDANNTSNLPGQLVCSGASCSSIDPDTQKAWSQLGETYDYFLGTHGRDSYDDKGSKLKGSVHYSSNYQNAYWSGTQMVFGDQMVALDVTAHELGHGVMQSTANLVYKYQPGALNESYSDVWGVMVDRDDWQLGEDLATIGVIRDMSNPEAYGQPRDMDGYKFYLFYDNGGVHINSGIPNYMVYLASDGGTNGGVVVRGVGRSAVEDVWYRVETTRLTSSARFSDFVRAVDQSCGELFGAQSNTCTEIGNAIQAVGL